MASLVSIHEKKDFCGGDGFFKNPYKIPKFGGKSKKMAENPITSKKLAGRISPDTSFFASMYLDDNVRKGNNQR